MRKVFEGFVVVAFLGLVAFAVGAKSYVSPRAGRALKVGLADEVTVRHGAAYPRLVQLAGGRLLVNDVASGDAGKSWQEHIPLPLDGRGGAGGLLSDERALLLEPEVRLGDDGLFHGTRWVSEDAGGPWTGPLEMAVSVPEAVPRDISLASALAAPRIHGEIVELSGGRLLTTMYGYFAADLLSAAGAVEPLERAKLRTVTIQSTDGGATWEYLATVAHDPAIGTDGFCEPTIVRLRDNRLLCAMRTGAELHQCFSKDEGATWSEPASLGVFGVSPRLCLTESGVLACAFGRPAPGIMLDSTGTGHGWRPPMAVFDGASTGHVGLEEIAPGVLLYVYDAQDVIEQEGSAPVDCIRGAFITVERA